MAELMYISILFYIIVCSVFSCFKIENTAKKIKVCVNICAKKDCWICACACVLCIADITGIQKPCSGIQRRHLGYLPPHGSRNGRVPGEESGIHEGLGPGEYRPVGFFYTPIPKRERLKTSPSFIFSAVV